jgi:hypothetical protein
VGVQGVSVGAGEAEQEPGTVDAVSRPFV